MRGSKAARHRRRLGLCLRAFVGPLRIRISVCRLSAVASCYGLCLASLSLPPRRRLRSRHSRSAQAQLQAVSRVLSQASASRSPTTARSVADPPQRGVRLFHQRRFQQLMLYSRRPLACRRRQWALYIWANSSGPQWGKPKVMDRERVELVSPATLSLLRQEPEVANGERVELVSPVILSCLRLEPTRWSM